MPFFGEYVGYSDKTFNAFKMVFGIRENDEPEYGRSGFWSEFVKLVVQFAWFSELGLWEKIKSTEMATYNFLYVWNFKSMATKV